MDQLQNGGEVKTRRTEVVNLLRDRQWLWRGLGLLLGLESRLRALRKRFLVSLDSATRIIRASLAIEKC